MSKLSADLYVQIGKRDAIAEMFMLIRSMGIEKTLEKLAHELNKSEPTGKHIHADWYLESYKKD